MGYNKDMQNIFKKKIRLYDKREYQLELWHDEVRNYYALRCVDGVKEMGLLTFNARNGRAWIYNVSTRPQYQNIGVGRTMLVVFESFLSAKKITLIEGKFYPTNEFAKPLYENLGYKIEKDGYETMLYKIVGTEIYHELEFKI